VLVIRAYAPRGAADAAVRSLEAIDEVEHVMRHPTANGDLEQVTAELSAEAVDLAIEGLLGAGVQVDQIEVERTTSIGPVERGRGAWRDHRADALVWAEVVEGAREHARLPARYLLFMFVAGVLAGFAVLLANPVLIVGAMAVSPDLLPVTAACVAIVGRRAGLFGRAIGTLGLGLTVVVVTALALTFLLDAVGYLVKLPVGSDLILTPEDELMLPIVIIAFVAGIAGMVATETRASAAVGVAISVTTIPASAYAGVAFALGQPRDAVLGLAILLANVVCLLLGGTLALVVQRALRRRRAAR
jgi:uncharacterized hydrophobic protein (TIGR00271 family)